MIKTRCKHCSALFFLLMTLTVLRPAMALDLLPDINLFGSGKEEGTYVWQGGLQYVKLVSLEEGAASPNQHPVRVSPEHMRMVLANISLVEEGGIFNDEKELVPLFVRNEVAVLGSALARALERATPEQDILFAVVGRHQSTIAKEQQVVTGRVFYLENRLNIVLGEAHEPLRVHGNDRAAALAAGCGDCVDDERYVENFIQGRRSKENDIDLPFKTGGGLRMHHQGEDIRSDWIKIDINEMVIALEKEQNRLPPQLLEEQKRARMEAEKTKLERRQMREEMARLKQQMEDGNGGASSKSLEERLQTLQSLKDKGLVSDEEYQNRRQEILSDI